MISGAISKNRTANLAMDTSLDIKAVNDLIKLAEASTDEALESEKDGVSPMLTRAKSMMKNVIPENITKVKFNALLTPGKRQQINKDEPDFNKKVSLSINWIVTLLKDLLNKVNGQSELITSLVKKLSTLVPRDDLEAELEKKKEQLETDYHKAIAKR